MKSSSKLYVCACNDRCRVAKKKTDLNPNLRIMSIERRRFK